MFRSCDIKWVKNVRRENGTDWAYYDNSMEDTFMLNFSNDQKKGALKIKPGEIILLFQRVDKVPFIKPRTYMTHLVTPLDGKLIENHGLDHRFKWERKVLVIARAEPKVAVYTTPNKLSFYKPQYGKVCSIGLLNENKTEEEIQREVWNHFDGFTNLNLAAHLANDEVQEDSYEDFEAREGAESLIFKQHLSRERNKLIVGIAKERALQKGNGKILCECCSFDFFKQYGDIGYSFIECHHGLSISTGGERITRIEDLHMVCSNCHRMLHRKQVKTGNYHTVKTLQKILLKHCL